MSEKEKLDKEDLAIDVNAKIPLGKAIPLSIQHLFAMFGASVLVSIIFNIGSCYSISF